MNQRRSPKSQPHFQEHEIHQKVSEPSRKSFSDGENFELVVWYQDPSFSQITGFQLSFRETPFATDDEYFLTSRPNKATILEVGKTRRESRLHPTSKVIHTTLPNLPDAFHEQIGIRLEGLPEEIRAFIQNRLKEIVKAKG